MNNKFDRINKHDLCLGCGLCEAIGRDKGYTMHLDADGFYKPVRSGAADIDVEEQIGRVCPSINNTAPRLPTAAVWGQVVSLHTVHSTDPSVRKNSSSGGGLSALSIFLIEKRMVDAVLHIGRASKNSIENKLFVSRTKEDVIENASSRYAPAQTFNDLISILDSSKDETFAFIGKPCDVSGLRNFLELYPKHKLRIKYYLSFFCAGMPSYNATLKLLEPARQNEIPYSLKYRGNGWPGHFTAKYKDGGTVQLTYEKSWGDVLGKHVHPRCKFCPDGIGLLADVVFGDAWETADGYPRFEELDGLSLAMVRTNSGKQLVQYAIDAGYLDAADLPEEKAAKMQPYQYQRRFFVGYRIVVIQLLTRFLLNFRNTGFPSLMSRYPLHRGIKNSLGTMRRFMKM